MSSTELDTEFDHSYEEPNNAKSYSSTDTQNTRATTPEHGLALEYRTILVPTEDASSVQSLDAAFIRYEPFAAWTCAFCDYEEDRCSCLAWPVLHGTVPTTKQDFLTYLESQEKSASALQHSSISYILAIEEHVPFSLAFNRDQRFKCNTMHHQLELIKTRIVDLKTASALLKDDEDRVPRGFRVACTFMESLLANCNGNARENHVCFKLNFKLTQGN
ncbi:MAG: hypothetical protein LQ340_004043 [Diploschistes diacapsis]|nr:MAG: hypothetical protein LQ340_004043 [Diploschistes diacapsis]